MIAHNSREIFDGPEACNRIRLMTDAEIEASAKKARRPLRNKIHPADQANIDAIAEASSFMVSLFHGGAYQKHENIPTLAAARAQGLAMQAETGSHRLSLVYAVLKDGRSFPVPRDYQAPTTPTENPMPNIAAALAKDRPKKAAAPKTARKPASKASQTAARTAAGERARFDWKTAEERATQGTLPSKLDFSADTHKSYRSLLAEIETAAKAGDIATLKKIKHDGFQGSSVRAALRWRDLCVKALNAKK